MQVDHLSHFLPVCHYWIVFFSPFVSPGQSLLPQANTNQHARTQMYPFLQVLILLQRLLCLGSMQPICRLSFPPHLSAVPGASATDLVGNKLLFLLCHSAGSCFLLLMFSSVFTSGTVMWGFQSTKLLIRRQGVQARVEGLILGYAVLCSSRSSLYAQKLCTTLCPGSFLALWWIFTLPAHLP